MERGVARSPRGTTSTPSTPSVHSLLHSLYVLSRAGHPSLRLLAISDNLRPAFGQTSKYVWPDTARYSLPCGVRVHTVLDAEGRGKGTFDGRRRAMRRQADELRWFVSLEKWKNPSRLSLLEEILVHDLDRVQLVRRLLFC